MGLNALDWVLPSFTEFSLISFQFGWSQWIIIGFTEFYRVFFDQLRIELVSMALHKLYRVLPSCNRSEWCFMKFYRVFFHVSLDRIRFFFAFAQREEIGNDRANNNTGIGNKFA